MPGVRASELGAKARTEQAPFPVSLHSLAPFRTSSRLSLALSVSIATKCFSSLFLSNGFFPFIFFRRSRDPQKCIFSARVSGDWEEVSARGQTERGGLEGVSDD